MTDRLDGRRVLVTGAAGLVGSAVTGLLLERGARVRAHAGPPGTDTGTLPAETEPALADICDATALGQLVRDADAVVHLAGPASVAASFGDPHGYARAHEIGTATVLAACRAAAVQTLVHISSAEIYGRTAHNPVAEDARPAPSSPYGVSKLAAESMVREQCAEARLAATVLRPFSVYGPRSPGRSLMGRLLRQVAAGDDPVRLADLRPVRDYVHVDDTAAAVAKALTAASSAVPVFNVGSGVGTSVLELAELALRTAGRDAVVEQVGGDRPSGGEIDELVADPRRSQEQLGWTPRVKLGAGLADALAWLAG